MLKEIAGFLMEKGFGVYDEDGWGGTMFIGIRPEKPDGCVALFQNGGEMPLLRELDNVERPGLQVQVRSTSPTEALLTADNIMKCLDQSSPTIDGVYYPYIGAEGSPFFMKRDENNRFIYAVNFKINRRIGEM